MNTCDEYVMRHRVLIAVFTFATTLNDFVVLTAIIGIGFTAVCSQLNHCDLLFLDKSSSGSSSLSSSKISAAKHRPHPSCVTSTGHQQTGLSM